MQRAPINKILPYSVVDGPGNRAVVFFQKCNLHCVYCHNPETQQLCCNCGSCVDTCPTGALQRIDGKVFWDETKCCECDTCIQHCPHNASPKVKWLSPSEVFAEIKRSLPFIRGITVSGGECCLYPDFVQALFKLAKKEKLTCLMDANGSIELSRYPQLMDVCDGVMLDVKAWHKSAFKRLTGGNIDPVKHNLYYLAQCGKLTEVRLVVVPGWVDDKAVIQGIAQSLGQATIQALPLKLIRFRQFGVRGVLENSPSPDTAYMQMLERYAGEMGFEQILVL